MNGFFSVIIEELQVANSHLRKMVDSLFYELSSCQAENLELKAKVRYLENLHHGKATGIMIQQQPQRPLMQSLSAQPSPSHHGNFQTFKPAVRTGPPMPIHNTARVGPPVQFAVLGVKTQIQYNRPRQFSRALQLAKNVRLTILPYHH